MAHYGMVIRHQALRGLQRVHRGVQDRRTTCPQDIFWQRARLTDGGDAARHCRRATFPDVSAALHHRRLPALREPRMREGVSRWAPPTRTRKRASCARTTTSASAAACASSACPYTGVRSFNWQEPALPHGLRPRRRRCSRAPEAYVVEKCIVLLSAAKHAAKPPRAWTCALPARATAGDLDDPGLRRVEAPQGTLVRAAAAERGNQALRLLSRIRRKENHDLEHLGDEVAQGSRRQVWGQRHQYRYRGRGPADHHGPGPVGHAAVRRHGPDRHAQP